MTNDPDKSGKKDIPRRYSDPISALRAEMKMFLGLEGAHASGVSNFGGVEHLQEIDPSESDDDGCSFQGGHHRSISSKVPAATLSASLKETKIKTWG
jgi:hypothetical protein